MTEHHTETERLWESGWDGHEKAQLLRMSKLPFIEKIKWLEEAHDIIQNLNPLGVSSSYPEDYTAKTLKHDSAQKDNAES